MNTNNIDPRLLTQVEQAGEASEVEAILLLADQEQTAGASASVDQLLLHRVSEATQHTPTSVRFMPHLNMLYVKGSGRFMRYLLEQNEVVWATVNETDSAVPEEDGSHAL